MENHSNLSSGTREFVNRVMRQVETSRADRFYARHKLEFAIFVYDRGVLVP